MLPALQGMFANTLLIITLCASSILLYALLLVIGVQPWWAPQYLIPILGETGTQAVPRSCQLAAGSAAAHKQRPTCMPVAHCAHLAARSNTD